MTGFGFDPGAPSLILRKADPALAGVIGAVGPFGMELKVSRSLFGALAEAIVYQQLSNKAAATIYGRIEALYPRAKTASRRRTSGARRMRRCAASACRAPRCWRCATLREKVAATSVADARRGASTRRRVR